MKANQIRWGILSSIAMAVLILDSQTALEGAKDGIGLCLGSLIPSLFPFFVLTSLMTGALLGTRLALLKPLSMILGIPEGCESILIPAFLGGYPAGAQCIAQAYRKNTISQNCAKRLLLFCNNPGPSFLFGILTPFFPEKGMVWSLWGLQILAALIWGSLLPPCKEESGAISPAEPSLTEAVGTALHSMANVCAWVILFRIIIAFAQRWFLWLLPSWVQVLFAGILELSNGCCSLMLLSDLRLRFVICAGLLSFGGLCVTMQTASLVRGLPMGPYILSKLGQSMLCIIMAALLWSGHFLLPALIVFLCISLKKTVEFGGTLLYNRGINQRRNPYAVSKENRARLRILPEKRAAGGGSDPLYQKRTAQSR